ncbi:solute carrier family 23 protein, partial [Staphylococcus pettenkoferi]|uniref:solute carrier family 23 protein n=1 Tax=Staphylococcus pettenkoferi TaxID=170573 RepID=UPI003B97B372
HYPLPKNILLPLITLLIILLIHPFTTPFFKSIPILIPLLLPTLIPPSFPILHLNQLPTPHSFSLPHPFTFPHFSFHFPPTLLFFILPLLTFIQ